MIDSLVLYELMLKLFLPIYSSNFLHGTLYIILIM